MLRPFLKPFCSLTKLSLASTHLLRRLFKTEQYILYRALASVMPRYERGPRGSAVLDLGIGFIIPFPQFDGITPFSKQTLNKMCKNEIAESFFRTSTGIRSRPLTLFLLASLTAFLLQKLKYTHLFRFQHNSGADLGLRYYQVTGYAACCITH